MTLAASPGISSVDVRVLDRNAEYLGVSTLQLMENAGRSVADEVSTRFGRGGSVVVYAGTGRNGGDGMVAARHLACRQFKLQFKLVGDENGIRDLNVQRNFQALKAMSASVKIERCRDSSELSESNSDILIDALLGTGVRGRLRQPLLRAVQVINGSRGFKVGVDVPSGIDSDTGEVLGEAVRANLTVTFHAVKKGMLKAERLCGEVKVADIGIPPEAILYVGPGDVDAVILKREADSHKGQFGRLLIIGGSRSYTGAPALAALAAYRAGTDLVYIAAPEEAAATISTISPSLITVRLPGGNLTLKHLKLLGEYLRQCTALVIGPGLGTATQTILAVRKTLSLAGELQKPILLDADGLKALGPLRKKTFNSDSVLTPHESEFKALTGRAPSKDLQGRIGDVKSFASTCGAVVLLKGHVDVVSNGFLHKLNYTGNPGMTVGGTGDVLSGIVGGLLAQGVDAFRAAVAAAFINGAAGDLAAERCGYHLAPSDLLEYIPTVMKDPMCHKSILESRASG